ncbi:HD-GYP domain-containing protein [Paenibacillus psychroresistens]|uniref:HD-GYP domain-containing protein n=1 Tax=Paenibacillus psychroresistens TaxID=1778678 RepID=A0A6B8RRV0_9BACL|nr:HD-GYP domain-containing protein [Paenibacillus psychroresistens]QGQ98452.1 HD-GYP domain-containing protein [Paenibacillus psychroresistens]
MQFTNYEDLVGKRLLQSVVNSKGMMIIPTETILSESHIDKLEKFKIETFNIHVELVTNEEVTVSVSDAPDSPKAAKANGSVKRTNALLQEIEDIVKYTGKVPIADVENFLLPTILEATKNSSIYKLFADLKAEGDFRFKHSIGVSYIAALLGRSLKMDEDEIAHLTIAASLCDIGSIKLPHTLLHKTSELDAGEYDMMKLHTYMGRDLLKESALDPRAAIVAVQHHEREDGSGYPQQLAGSEIHIFSKIVALADVYVAMTSDRPQRPALPFFQVIHTVYENILHGQFDSKIGLTFLNLLMNAQIGSEVILSNGKKASIVLVHASNPASPLISVDGAFIDLSKTSSLQIMEIVG